MNDIATHIGPVALADLMQTGISAYRDGAFAQAVQNFNAVLMIAPDHQAARINVANALWASGRLAEAAASADIAHRDSPQSAEAWMITGATRLDSGNASGAAEAYRRAISCQPMLAGAHAGLGAAWLACSRPTKARESALAALSLEPGHVHALFTLGSSCAAMELRNAALAAFDAVLEAAPGHARAHLNRSNLMINVDRIDDAVAGLCEAVRCDHTLKEAWVSLAFALTIHGDLAGAVAACDRAIELDADFAVAHWNRGVACLLDGEFAAGFAAYEWRKRHPVYRHQFTKPVAPDWTGDHLTRRHLLVRAEQGFGDTIMLARFLPALAMQARCITLACPPSLFPLFETWPITLCKLDQPAVSVDVTVDQMSLPHILALSETTIPCASGYLMGDATRIARWNKVMPRHPGRRRIAVTWAGNPLHDNDRRRSLPVGALAPLLAIEGIDFVGIQFGARRYEYNITDATGLIVDFGDSAALIAGCDAVVTVDTSVAHLAGALGVTCHVLLSAACDWRWRHGRRTSQWYDSMILHRQTCLGDWCGPLEAVTAALR